MVIVAVDPRMAPLSPTGTALRAAFGRFAGIHAALLSMPVRPLGYRHGPTGRPSGRSSRRAAPCAALEQFQSENALSLVSSGNGQKIRGGACAPPRQPTSHQRGGPFESAAPPAPVWFLPLGRARGFCCFSAAAEPYRTGVYSMLETSSVASSLKMTGRRPSLQLQMATPGVLIQSP